MTTLTAARVAELPRVNLLPPEIGHAARLRRLQVLLGLLLLGVVGLAAMLYTWAGTQVSSAQSAYDQAQAENQQLTAEVNSYAEVPLVEAQVDGTRQALVTAMQPEIRWSYLLNDMSLTIPKSSRLTSWVAVNNAAAAQVADPLAASSAAATDGTGELPPSEASMGTVDFIASTTKLQEVSTWLNMLANQKSYFDPALDDATVSAGDTVGKFYTVTSNAGLTYEAASNRYEQVMEGK